MKKILVMLIASLACLGANAVTASGTFLAHDSISNADVSVNWSIVDETLTLTAGEQYAIVLNEAIRPWQSYAGSVTNIVLQGGFYKLAGSCLGHDFTADYEQEMHLSFTGTNGAEGKTILYNFGLKWTDAYDLEAWSQIGHIAFRVNTPGFKHFDVVFDDWDSSERYALTEAALCVTEQAGSAEVLKTELMQHAGNLSISSMFGTELKWEGSIYGKTAERSGCVLTRNNWNEPIPLAWRVNAAGDSLVLEGSIYHHVLDAGKMQLQYLWEPYIANVEHIVLRGSFVTLTEEALGRGYTDGILYDITLEGRNLAGYTVFYNLTLKDNTGNCVQPRVLNFYTETEQFIDFNVNILPENTTFGNTVVYVNSHVDDYRASIMTSYAPTDPFVFAGIGTLMMRKANEVLNVVPSTGEVEVMWNPVPGAKWYKLLVQDGSDEAEVIINTIDAWGSVAATPIGAPKRVKMDGGMTITVTITVTGQSATLANPLSQVITARISNLSNRRVLLAPARAGQESGSQDGCAIVWRALGNALTPEAAATLRQNTVYFGKSDVLRTGLTPGSVGTFCSTKEVLYPAGATFYQIAYADKADNGDLTAVYFDPVETLEAGRGYIFVANGTEIAGVTNGAAVSEVVAAADNNGLQGTLSNIEAYSWAEGANELTGNYIVYQNELRKCGNYCVLSAGRAYIVKADVPDDEPIIAPAPGRRISLMTDAAHTPTALENAQAEMTKGRMLLENGLLIILRDNKKYSLTGQHL